jgi:EAL domain-containing protein (putative c-di-GMP-specific phosphodiesterase class I)
MKFVVLLENLDNTGGYARQHAELVAGKILRTLSADRNEVGRNDQPPHRVTRTAAQGADPRHLKVELTESVLLHDVEEVIAKMTSLKARGVCFALDDFGTGYSSLSYLQRLPLDQLKIDKSFVRYMLDSQNAATIVRAIVALADSLDMDVVAEGGETEAQRQFLRECGCASYQGYLIGKPVPAEKLVHERPFFGRGALD